MNTAVFTLSAEQRSIAGNIRHALWEQINEFVLDRPRLAMISVVAFAALGIASCMAALIALPFIPLKALSIGATGGISFCLSVATTVALVKQFGYLKSLFSHLTYGAVSGHAMEVQAFEEKSCEGGELKYVNGIPVLKLTVKDPFEMGYAHGYLAGKNIHEMWKKYLVPGSCLLFRTRKGYQKLVEEAKNMYIPSPYREEMEGIVKGYNQWLQERDANEGFLIASRPVMLEDVIAWHSFIDIYKEDMGLSSPIGCSAMAIKKDGVVTLGRNLDWPGLEVAPKNTLAIARQPQDGNASVIICFPGNVGSITGMNSVGLCTVVNEAGRVYKKGNMPYNLLHREILDSCSSIRQAKECAKRNPPASSHLMTLATPHEASVLQFYPNETDDFTERGMENNVLAVTNHCTDKSGECIPETEVSKTSEWRKRTLENDVPHANPAESIEAALKVVQNDITIHKIMLHPQQRKIALAWDYSYAADQEMHEASFHEFFD